MWTLNNWREEQVDWLAQYSQECERLKYICWGYEKGEEGTPHLQGMCVYKNPRSFKAVCRELQEVVDVKMHVEQAKKPAIACMRYCQKDGDFFENDPEARPKEQGARSDLETLRDAIVIGAVTVDDVALLNPFMFHQYGRTLEKIQGIVGRKKYRDWRTEGLWMWGPTGVGKSYQVKMQWKKDPDNWYKLHEDGGWWEGYSGQENVWIDEFRGGIPYNQLLQLIDDTPFQVKMRYRGTIPFLSKKIWITSCMPPDEVYNNLAEKDSLAQLYRRCKIEHVQTREECEKSAQRYSSCNTKRDESTINSEVEEDSDAEEDVSRRPDLGT